MRNSYAPPVSGAELGSARVGARWAGPLTRRSWVFFSRFFSFSDFLFLLFFIWVFRFFFHSFLYFSLL
jgi:hypothetical protein